MATSTAQAIATVPVWDYLMNPGDGRLTNPKGLGGKKVKISLTYSLAQSASPVTLLGTDPIYADTDPNGFWQVNLVPNNKISPGGTLYSVSIEGYRTYLIQVTDVNVPGIGWQSVAIAILPPVGGGAPGYTLPGGTNVLGAFTVNGLLDVEGLSQFDQKATFSQGPVIDITHEDYGAKGDTRWVSDAAMTLGSANLDSTTAGFVAADVGKVALVQGAGSFAGDGTGGTLEATILSITSPTRAVLSKVAITTAAGKQACVGTGNAVAIQKAINQQQTAGGRIKVPKDSYGGKYLVEALLIPAPGLNGVYTDATFPLYIEGDGYEVSSLVAGIHFSFTGLIGYLTSPSTKHAQVICSDLTIDGNYAGATGTVGGAYGQETVSGVGALLSLPAPYKTVQDVLMNGTIHHQFWRVRFYRPTGYVFQGTNGIDCFSCEFVQVGQPDLAAGAVHYDNLGSGQGDAVVVGCKWWNSSGNYVDFVDSTGGAGHIVRVIFIGNESFNHQLGGLYGCGTGSVITANRLVNTVGGSGVGYDAATHASVRSKNIVYGNVFDNINVNSSGLSAALYGDLVYGNTSADHPAGINALDQGGVVFGMGVQNIPYAATITPDLSKGQVLIVGTLTGDMTVNAPTNMLPWQLVIFRFTQDATGNRAAFFTSAYKGVAFEQLFDANSTSYMVFLSDASGQLWLLNTAIDQTGKMATLNAEGLQLVGNVRSLSAPVVSSDGTTIYIQAAAAQIWFRPNGYGNNSQAITIDNVGTFRTWDAGFVLRNVLDDNAGNMGPKFHLYPGAEAGGFQSLGGFLHSTGVPSNANGNNKDWCISDNGHLYFRTGGVWVDMTAAVTAQSTPGNPAGTASTTGVMMGLAGSITPVRTGNVLVIVSGDIFNNTINDGGTVQIRTGTGTAPINGAALTGTARGGQPATTAAVGSEKSPFSVQAVVSGLALGTAVWIDLGVAAVTGGTASVENISISAVEV